MIAICYIDDMIVFAKIGSSIDNPKMELGEKWKVKDLGEPSQFFGIEVHWSSDQAVGLRQRRLNCKFRLTTGMGNAKPVMSLISTTLS